MTTVQRVKRVKAVLAGAGVGFLAMAAFLAASYLFLALVLGVVGALLRIAACELGGLERLAEEVEGAAEAASAVRVAAVQAPQVWITGHDEPEEDVCIIRVVPGMEDLVARALDTELGHYDWGRSTVFEVVAPAHRWLDVAQAVNQHVPGFVNLSFDLRKMTTIDRKNMWFSPTDMEEVVARR